jgi:hypothetical protein
MSYQPDEVYLAGGMRSGWQDTVKEAVPGLLYLDPREHQTQTGMTTEEYGAVDRHLVGRAGIVFAYLERMNPGIVGLACECAQAKTLGKTVILILEPGNTTVQDRYLNFIRLYADVTFETLAEGIAHLWFYQPPHRRPNRTS